MKKEKAKSRLKKIGEEMSKALNSFLLIADQVQLHAFRVQVKKMKSLLVLLSSNEKNKSLFNYFKPIKQIFRHAGRIRDPYLHLKLASEFKIKDQEFFEQQKRMMEEELSLFLKHGKKYLQMLNKAIGKLVKKLKKTNDAAITDFFNTELDQVVLAFAKREFDESMHDCRKMIKNILYNYKFMKKSLGDRISLNIPYLSGVQETIGSWHDSVLVAGLIENRIGKSPRALTRLNDRIRKEERAVTSISTDFWQKVTSPVTEHPEEQKSLMPHTELV
ncbi:CHAD domain-containing protein [Desertivirga brevis]|uniref:CHAD domain-containing protein n=1 Tax=Desertivirga brevis TaxID=2810310 RepID=UPI001A96DF9C|nr:CHAD domain-containing protein [Pedobacter sp. SYSU D00873]